MAKLGYDPVKAHEYYIRTRKLKGRQPGQQTHPSVSTSSPSSSNAQVKVSGKGGTDSKKKPTTHAAQRISQMQQRLNKLTQAYNKALADARKLPPTSTEAQNRSRLFLDADSNVDPVIDM